MKVLEIGINVKEHGGRRASEGAIIAAREPAMFVGLLEMERYLWAWVQLPDIEALLVLAAIGDVPYPYSVDMRRLYEMRPDLDMHRLTDPYVIYQPLLTLDAKTGERLGLMEPLDGMRLIIDHRTGRFIGG